MTGHLAPLPPRAFIWTSHRLQSEPPRRAAGSNVPAAASGCTHGGGDRPRMAPPSATMPGPSDLPGSPSQPFHYRANLHYSRAGAWGDILLLVRCPPAGPWGSCTGTIAVRHP